MKRCSYCGQEYPDEVVQCSIDGMVLTAEEPAVPPLIDPPPLIAQIESLPSSPSSVASDAAIPDRRWRIFELSLVCVLAFGSSLLLSVYYLFAPYLPRSESGIQWTHGILHECTALAILWYVLRRQSKSLVDLGFGWKWSDLGWSIVLWFAGGMAFSVMYRTLYYSGLTPVDSHASARRVTDYLFGGGVVVGTLIFQCINPFFEELIVRGYLMTEVRQLTNSVMKAVIFSTVLQTSYHLYQGAPMAISDGALFLVWSLYYAKTKRITPVILAHLYTDVFATLWYMARH